MQGVGVDIDGVSVQPGNGFCEQIPKQWVKSADKMDQIRLKGPIFPCDCPFRQHFKPRTI